MKTVFLRAALLLVAIAAFIVSCNQPQPSDLEKGLVGGVGSCGPVNGAIFTTDVACNGTNVNIFGTKEAVYLDGGPLHPGAAGLPDGQYYVQVTVPNGALLGTTIGTTTEKPVVVVNGEFQVCYQLWAILRKASNPGPYPVAPDGYDNTTNGGGEYKVWVSQDPTFPGGCTKTDNFKVKTGGNGTLPSATLCVEKFYDANVDGIDNDLQPIAGWIVHITGGTDLFRATPSCVVVDPGDYTVTELDPIEPTWFHTTPASVNVTLADQSTTTVKFGNVCLGAGGGKTLGFWSNKNGQAQMNDGNTSVPELTMLSALCLRDASGANFDPASYATFRTWILNATATNMAYMLSAQLAAMELNVEAGFVSGSSLVYVPGCGNTGVDNNFMTIAGLLTAAENALCADGYTPSGDPNRAYQECLKNALDNANNNKNFVQATPCPFSFAP